MKHKNTIILLILLAPFAFFGCSDNIFGDAGSGEDCKEDVKCLRIAAEEQFRQNNYKEAYELYKQIVEANPNASVGYFGMAKAGLWQHGLTIFNIVGLTKENKDSEDVLEILFKTDQNFKNDYLQGAKKAYRALMILNKRDSLTELYNKYLENPNATDSISLVFKKSYNCNNGVCEDTTTFKEFKEFHCEKNKNHECKEKVKAIKEKFPLSDLEFRKSNLNAGFYISQTIFEPLSFIFDQWNNGCIYEKKPKDDDGARKLGCDVVPVEGLNTSSIFSYEDGKLQLNLEGLYEELLEDTSSIKAINEMLDNFDDKIVDLVDMISQTGDFGEADEVQERLEDLKGYTAFYKLHVGIDADGDGCVDEELVFRNKVYDSDGDGIWGENTRIIFVPDNAFDGCGFDTTSTNCRYTPTRYFAHGATVDHNKNNNKDDYFIMILTRLEEGVIDTTIRAAWSLPKDFWAPEGKEANIEIRKEVQTEKTSDGKTKCWTLQDRKDRIGGCWRNYSPDDFENYRKNPLQITEGGMNEACKERY